MRTLLSHPLEFPQEFLGWLIKYMEAHPPTLPLSSMSGYAALTTSIAAAAGSLGSGSKTTDTLLNQTVEASAVTIAATSAITLDGATRVRLEFSFPAVFNNNNNRILTIIFHDGTSVLCRALGPYQVIANTNDLAGATAVYYYTPAAGTYTFSARGYANVNTNLTIRGGAAGSATARPATIEVSAA